MDVTAKARSRTALPPRLLRTDMQYSEEDSKDWREEARWEEETSDSRVDDGTWLHNSISSVFSMSTNALVIRAIAKSVYLVHVLRNIHHYCTKG